MDAKQTQNRWKGYLQGHKNRIVIRISDSCFDGTSTPVRIDRTPADAELFFEKLISFCKREGYSVENYGTESEMAARLNKRNEENLYTETEVLDFTKESVIKINKAYGLLVPIPTMEELHKYITKSI